MYSLHEIMNQTCFLPVSGYNLHVSLSTIQVGGMLTSLVKQVAIINCIVDKTTPKRLQENFVE